MNNDNQVIPVSQLNPVDIKKDSFNKPDRCSGCGKEKPGFFSIQWQLFVCGADTCKPYDIASDIAHHAMTGN